MSPIIKTFFGKHIDLDKLIAISEVKPSGYNSVYFEMWFQLQDKPIIHDENFLGRYDEYPNMTAYHNAVVAPEIIKLQAKVDELIQVWKNHKAAVGKV